MVAELTGIPVSTGVPGRSSKASRILGIRRSDTCYSTSTASSTTDDRNDRKRPRWIRAATREPIYSVLDDREHSGFADRRLTSGRLTGRTGSRERQYEISAVRGKIARPVNSTEVHRAIGGEEVDECDEEHALYSVVRKPPKNIFVEERKKLPVLEEEEPQDPREEILKRQKELHKWLQGASGGGFEEAREPECSRNRGFRGPRKMSEEIEDSLEEKGIAGDPREVAGNRKRDDSWSPLGVSVPRGVVGMVGPFCRIYRNPNERREYMLKEEVEERGIDLGFNGDGGDERRMEADEEDAEEEEAVTAVDTISEADTFVDLVGDERNESTKPRDHETDDETSAVEQQRHRRRAKWRIIEDDETREATVKKMDDEAEEKSVVKGEWLKDAEGHLGSVVADEVYDLEVPPKYSSRRSEASNEPHDKDSLNETGSTTGGTVEGNHSGNPARGERNPGPSDTVATGERRPIPNTVPARSLVSRILARARSPDELLNHSEPYSQLWIVLSNVYGELVVVLMMALCLAEVMDTPVPLLSLQSVYLMYLYVGSIAVIISIYLWVLVDSCGSLANGNSGTEDAELGGASLTRFGSLKRAHISRARTAPTSFYIRVGALLFGLATLVFNGLEMAMHSMMQGADCLSDVVFVHPALHGLFTFLQMHFLFVNSQVLVERFGLAARFGFTHLAATNIAVWVRLVIWDSAQEWTYFVHLAQRGAKTSSSPLNLRGFPGSLTRRARDLLERASTEDVVLHPYQPISPEQISQVVTLQECLNTNTLGQLWTSSMPFLYPFIVQFSLIAAAVTFVMGQNVGKSRYCHKQKFHSSKDLASHTRVGCDGSSKGLFLGILCMTAGIVVILIFLVVREDENFSPATLSWLTCGTLIGILAMSGVMTASGLLQVRQMSVVSRAPAALDGILSNVSLFGVQLYSVFTAVVCACSLATFDEETQDADIKGRHAMLLAASILQLAQCFAQSTLIAETSKRSCITRFQLMTKPARQVITFLLFSNAVLWAFDTVVTQNWVSQELQLRFFGVLAWGIVSRICLPLVVFYRFHSCVLLLEAWNKCYRTPRGEHPLN